jgi:hypothetical protein
MAMPEERFDFHIQIEAEGLETLDALVREFRPYVIRIGPALPSGKPYTLDALVSEALRARLERAGHQVKVLARVNQAEDLRAQVSQTNRFAEELEQLKKRRD